MKPTTRARLALLVALTCAGAPAFAQDRDRGREYERGGPPLRLDQRYHHDHYYPARGYVVEALPRGSVRIGVRGGDYWYHGGVWFRPEGARYVVAPPPFGVVVPVLPPAYATVYFGGAPYYYANGVYYARAPGQGYTVVEPPPGADDADGGYAPAPPQPMPMPPQPSAPGRAAEPIVYPRNGQPPQQVEADKTDCFRWATQNSVGADASTYQRAFGACMDGRGYSVR